MKSIVGTTSLVAASILLLGSPSTSVDAFQPSALPTVRSSNVVTFGYVPDGFTPESYKKFQEKEAKKKTAKKNLGGLGPRGFKSRSMQSFQEAMERGEATHLMPVFNAKEKINSGELRPEDIPYMQRGGSWDNRDIKSAKNRKKWLKSDKEYATGGYKKEQSVSIFGYGEGLDWTGKNKRKGPSESVVGAAPKFSKNYKAPNVKNIKGSKAAKAAAQEEKPKKKGGFFGMF
mmetsp:Transcript_22137/g.30809  ORF Transcript_22137/g.30809 Transcript_22137/m.30809 type:complete len:231 (-) Transcript_22137:170-862(-)